MQRIIKGTQVRVYLALQIPWQKAQLLPRLNRRAGKDNPAYFFLLECRNCHRHCQVCLARAGRPQPKDNHLAAYLFYIIPLPQGLWLHRSAADGVANQFLVNLHKRRFLLFKRKGNRIIHILLRNLAAPLGQRKELGKHPGGLLHITLSSQ